MDFRFIFLFGVIMLLKFSSCVERRRVAEYDDNDFAEFEDFEDESPVQKKSGSPMQPKAAPSHSGSVKDDPNKMTEDEFEDFHDDEEIERKNTDREYRSTIHQDNDLDEDEAVVEEDDDSDEFSHFSDEDEFIGFDGERSQGAGKSSRNKEEPKITIAKVPLHLRSNWDSFYLEMLMMAGLLVYFINFFFGKAKNQRIATTWFETHKTLFESNFALVGDDGKPEIENPGLRKESENIYILWCSGRPALSGMLVELRLLKRQDLIGVISQVIRPTADQVIVSVDVDEMDTFVFAFGTKRSAGRLAKDMTDICTYCPERKAGEKYGIGSQFVVHSELVEVATLILKDPKVMSVLSKNANQLEFFHFSDQYSGPKQQEETTPTNPPQVKKSLMFGFNFPKGNLTADVIEGMKLQMNLVFYLINKLTKLKLSKEAKSKADKNRAKVEEAFLKATHALRAEQAQTRREEKRRQERERIMNLDDPEKQRKWEEKEQKREMKRRAPKMKTLKIKPM